MSNHKRFEELIQAYLDNSINDTDKKELLEHIKGCSKCKKELGERKQLISLLRESREDVEPPNEIIQEILSETTGKKETSSLRVWRFVTVGAAAIIIITLIIYSLFSHLVTGDKKISREEEKIEKTISIPDEKITDKESLEENENKKSMYVREEEKDREEKGIIEFEENYLVFPEDGSVVGENFEIVVILDKPGDKIELSIDGEDMIFDSEDSSIIYISSSELPVLEKGIHYLSLREPMKSSIKFYKES